MCRWSLWLARTLELPRATKQRLGIDDDRSWVILDHANEFQWPGPDVRQVPGALPATIYYGPLPPALFGGCASSSSACSGPAVCGPGCGLSERTSRGTCIRLQRDADVAVIRVRNHLPNAEINAVDAAQMAPHSSHLNAELDEKH